MKRMCAFLAAVMLCVVLYLPAKAETAPPQHVTDGAGLLTDEEVKELESYLALLSEELQFDIVVVTVQTLGYQSEVAYADDFYDRGGYGYGSEFDGALLLVSAEDEILYVSTCGEGIAAIDEELHLVSQNVRAHWDIGRSKEAFCAFADTCAELVREYRRFVVTVVIVGSLIVGFLIALISVSVMKSKLKSVRSRAGAADYARAGSLHITDSRDLFLYRHVTRRALPKSNSSGGGSHTSSSGRSHGGGRI